MIAQAAQLEVSLERLSAADAKPTSYREQSKCCPSRHVQVHWQLNWCSMPVWKVILPAALVSPILFYFASGWWCRQISDLTSSPSRNPSCPLIFSHGWSSTGMAHPCSIWNHRKREDAFPHLIFTGSTILLFPYPFLDSPFFCVLSKSLCCLCNV